MTTSEDLQANSWEFWKGVPEATISLLRWQRDQEKFFQTLLIISGIESPCSTFSRTTNPELPLQNDKEGIIGKQSFDEELVER